MEDLELILHPMVEDAQGSRRLDGRRHAARRAVGAAIAACTTSSGRTSARSPTRRSTACARARVMSLKTRFGNLGNILDEDESQCRLLQLETPVLLTAEFQAHARLHGRQRRRDRLHLRRRAAASNALARRHRAASASEAEDAVRGGARATDPAHRRDAWAPSRAAIPMILATGAVHTHLVRQQLRTFTSLNVRSAECLDMHYFAVLIGVGATTVNAYLAQEAHRRPPCARPLRRARARRIASTRYKKAIDAGPAQDHVQDGHLGHLLLSRRLQFRGGRPVAHAGRRILSRHDRRASPASASRHPAARCWSCTRAPATRMSSALPIGGFYRYRARRRDACLGRRADPHAAGAPSPPTPTQTFKQLQRGDAQAAAGRRCATCWTSGRGRQPVSIDEVEIDHRDPQALRHARHVAGRAVARGARHAQHRHEPHRRQVGLRRRRRGSARASSRCPTATTPTPRSSRSPRAASASPPNTSTTAASSRSRSRRAPSPARAASCPASR